MSAPEEPPETSNEPEATRLPSIRIKVSFGNRPRRLNWTVPSPPLPMFRFTVPPASCGMNSCRSVALRIPSFSMSCGRYVSTGLGPVSSAVGMFEPVTTTRSTSAAPGDAAGAAGAGNCANTFDANIRGNPTLAIKAAPRNPSLFSTFLVISFSFRFYLLLQNRMTVTPLVGARVSTPRATALGHKSGSFGQDSESLGQCPFVSLLERRRGQLRVETVQIAEAISNF